MYFAERAGTSMFLLLYERPSRLVHLDAAKFASLWLCGGCN